MVRTGAKSTHWLLEYIVVGTWFEPQEVSVKWNKRILHQQYVTYLYLVMLTALIF